MIRILVIFFASIFSILASAAEYDRDDWDHWEDFDNDCQNYRHEVPIQYSLVPVTFTSEDGCYVETGAWLDPYTGKVYTNASELDIDHVIPLRYAHEYGGAQWPPILKKIFANDTDNMLIVGLGENRSKGWSGPRETLNKSPILR